MTEKKENKCTTFEEMLMWTSYRYCIGRHTYVTTMAADIAQHYYNKLSKDRKEFTSKDIRNEIFECLRWLPFKFQIHRIYNEDEFNPIKVLMNFFEREKIDSRDKLAEYAKVEYESHSDEYAITKESPVIGSYISTSDIEDLLPWESLAACFDMKNHKIITLKNGNEETKVRCFRTWAAKCYPLEDKPGYYRRAEFGWEPVWVSVDDFVKKGNGYHSHINDDYIVSIEDVEE